MAMRMKILIGCFSLLGIIEMCFSNKLVGGVLNCLKEEVCDVENGIDRAVYCAEMISEPDMRFLFETVKDYYPGTTELFPLFEQVCADTDKGVEVISYWFEEKEKRFTDQTAEETQAELSSRACFFLMVTECELKKAMGFFG